MKKTDFLEGCKQGFPIALGYLAVSFSLGIAARRGGLTALQGFLASGLCLASAGEYALFNAISEKAPYIEIALITLVVNARYLLMSCALSQKFSPRTSFIHRLGVGYGITDEIFAISINRKGNISPYFNYGAIVTAGFLWSLGTSLGIIAGEILPLQVVSALSVALYGMFLAIIIPPCKDKVIGTAVITSFLLSYAFTKLPFLMKISGGTKTIILTVLISALCALIKPIKEEENA